MPFGRSTTLFRRMRAAAGAAVVCITAALVSTQAAAQSKHATMILDANSGEVLHAEKADEPRYPASLTKMMTLYIVFEHLESGRLTPTTRIRVSQEAAAAQPTKLDLEPGETITVMDAVKALITKSANDMAIALAEAIAGTEARFAQVMTQKAQAIGMRNTVFRNASGLPDPGQVTTARDMVTLGLRLQDDYPKYYPLFALRAFTYNGSSYRNHNTMLNSFEGIDGIKTGYTRMSGFNLVTSLKRGDKHLVGAVFGGATAGTRNMTMRILLTRALLKASSKKTRKPAPVLVARAKPAARPEAKAAPAAVAVAAPVAPAKAKPAQMAAAAPAKTAPASPPHNAPAPPPQPRPVTVAAAEPEQQPTPAEASEPAPAPAIEIARVRPVMVAPRVKRTAFVIPPDQTQGTDTAEPEPQPTPAMTAAAAALAAPPAQPAKAAATDVPVAPVLPPTTPVSLPSRAEPPQVAPVLAKAVEPVPTRVAVTPPPAPARSLAQPPASVPPAGNQRGAPPSTFQAQAQALTRGVPTSAAMPQPAPAQFRAAAASGALPRGFHIQIGAFGSAGEAERALRDTQARSNGLLGAATPVTAPVQKENRLLYRARFAGFSAQSAADTCLALRRAAIDCFVMKAE